MNVRPRAFRRCMRLAIVAGLAATALAAPGRGDALRRTVAPMTRADGAVCELLRAEPRASSAFAVGAGGAWSAALAPRAPTAPETSGRELCYDSQMTASRATLRRLIRARDALHADPRRGATLDELAAVSGLSRGFLARSFARTFGTPPHQYLVQLRLEHAKRALARGTSVTETCLEVGFESLGSFSASFHRRVGVSPREWQRRSRALVQGIGMPALYIPACFL